MHAASPFQARTHARRLKLCLPEAETAPYAPRNFATAYSPLSSSFGKAVVYPATKPPLPKRKGNTTAEVATCKQSRDLDGNVKQQPLHW